MRTMVVSAVLVAMVLATMAACGPAGQSHSAEYNSAYVWIQAACYTAIGADRFLHTATIQRVSNTEYLVRCGSTSDADGGRSPATNHP